MMIASVRRLERVDVRRMIAAGSAWGGIVSAGLLAIAWQQCGAPCLIDVAVTTAASVTLGIAVIGPIAAFTRS
jgi:hypothetical protein